MSLFGSGSDEFEQAASVGDIRLFGVWGKVADGSCLCPRGRLHQDVRDHRISSVGTCDHPGKHPIPLEVLGGPSGAADAVPLDVWRELEPAARLLGAAPAAAIPGSMWVLDADSRDAWRDVVRMFKSGAVTFDQVACVAQTRRGWHVWLNVGSGWKSSSATDVVRKAGFETVEVKSQGTYVVLPGGFDGGVERTWMSVRTFADRVAWYGRLIRRWSDEDRRDHIAVGSGPVYAGGSESPWAEVFPPEVFAPLDMTDVRPMRWALLTERAGILSRMSEGSRNVTLNRLGYFEGCAAIEAGCPAEEVMGVLRNAGLSSGLGAGEVEATIRSSLKSVLG